MADTARDAAPAEAMRHQTWLGAGVVVLALGLAWGATSISSDAGYAGVGPNFLPWVAAGLLGLCGVWLVCFILSCALCFVLAVRGFKASEGRLDLSPRAWITDALIGMAISAPVYWMFTKALAINLPGLTSTGWL
jgi:putative tricarboxylic transport membrane protein